MTLDNWVIYHSENWSALYIDGKLAKRGDTYLIWEDICTRLGIEEHQNDDFLDGRDAYETLEEVHAASARRRHIELQANRLREQAQELLQQADRIEESMQ